MKITAGQLNEKLQDAYLKGFKAGRGEGFQKAMYYYRELHTLIERIARQE